jgi:hypothetical protein
MKDDRDVWCRYLCRGERVRTTQEKKLEKRHLTFLFQKLFRVMGHCDRTTSEMRGSSLKIISGDSRRSENAQTHTLKNTVPNMKFKLKLLQIKCHVLEFTQDKA